MSDTVAIPDFVVETLRKVRSTGLINMFDRVGVYRLANKYNGRASIWLRENPRLYASALSALGEVLERENK